jgi:hypothetical protein
VQDQQEIGLIATVILTSLLGSTSGADIKHPSSPVTWHIFINACRIGEMDNVSALRRMKTSKYSKGMAAAIV